APELTALTWFGLGESLLLSGRYEKALEALKRYIAATDADTETLRLADKYMADCTFSLAALKQPVAFAPSTPVRPSIVYTTNFSLGPLQTSGGSASREKPISAKVFMNACRTAWVPGCRRVR